MMDVPATPTTLVPRSPTNWTRGPRAVPGRGLASRGTGKEDCGGVSPGPMAVAERREM